MSRIFLSLLILFTLELATACGSSSSLGGSEAGNPPDLTTRSLVGELVDSSASVSAFLASSSCPADTVIAVDSTGTSTTATVAEDCTFELVLTVDKAYALQFVLDDEFVASMIFQNGANLTQSSVFVITAGDTTVNLGLIQISSGQAIPSIEPATECDQDEDGIDDYDDEDDNNDGVSDDTETDCDDDGYLNSYDEDDSTCDDSGNDGSSGSGSGDDSVDDSTDDSVDDN